MAEYSKLARGSFTSNGTSQTIYLPFLPGTVDMLNITNFEAQTHYIPVRAHWDRSMPDNSCLAEFYNADSAWETSYTTTQGLYAYARSIGNILGPQQQIIAATKNGINTPFNVSNHGYISGNVVIFEGLYQSQSTGMPQICGIPFIISVIDSNNFSIQWNTNQSNYTSLSGSPTGAFVRQVMNPELYTPGVEYITSLGTGATTGVTVTTNTNFKVGQTVSFRISSPWGTTQLNPGQNPYIPGFIVYGTVTALGGQANQFTVNINSADFTTFTTNVPVALVPGLTPPQIVAVGDINTGGGPVLASGSGNSSYIQTPNGPAITGAFANNTAFAMTMGENMISSAGNSNGQLISWTATAYDYVVGT